MNATDGTYKNSRQLVAFSSQNTSAQIVLSAASKPMGLLIGNQSA
jgi:hypothetical protein